ncbi:MAG: hypothetical protein WBA77_01905 [Microcoleaceae cyanobacterium]
MICQVSGVLTRYGDDKFSKLEPEEKKPIRRKFIHQSIQERDRPIQAMEEQKRLLD